MSVSVDVSGSFCGNWRGHADRSDDDDDDLPELLSSSDDDNDDLPELLSSSDDDDDDIPDDLPELHLTSVQHQTQLTGKREEEKREKEEEKREEKEDDDLPELDEETADDEDDDLPELEPSPFLAPPSPPFVLPVVAFAAVPPFVVLDGNHRVGQLFNVGQVDQLFNVLLHYSPDSPVSPSADPTSPPTAPTPFDADNADYDPPSPSFGTPSLPGPG